MFYLVNETVRLVNVNLRKERHGDSKVLACDLKFEAKLHNSVLNKLSPGLKDSMYTQDPGATVDMINPDHAPKLRHPEASAIKLAVDLHNVRLGVLEDGTNNEDMIFTGSKCNRFTTLSQEGGTVVVGFCVQITAPTKRDIGELGFLIDEMMKVNLEVEAQEELKESESEDDGERPGNVVDMFPASGAQDEGGDQSQADDEGDPRTPEELAHDEAARKVAMGITEDQEYNELYEKAAAFARGRSNVSTSVIKREFKISQLEAVRLLDQMESEGIVGEAAGNGVREVFALPAATA